MSTSKGARLISTLPTFSRTTKPASIASRPLICRACKRTFAVSAISQAGHNKWSKTKHIKAVTDKRKAEGRTHASNLIALYSRLYGDNVDSNPQLANAISAATKASVPRNVIENAIARGQGRSAAGAQLEYMTMEFLVPPDVAIVIDVETDSKNRSLQDLRSAVKKTGGLNGSSAFFFTRRGRAVFSPPKHTGNGGSPADPVPSISEVLDAAVEFEGTEDVEELDSGEYVVWTEPNMLAAVTQGLAGTLSQLELQESEIVWAPNEDTKISVDSDEVVETLDAMFDSLREHPEVKKLYANIRRGKVSEEQWERVERHIDC